MAARILCACAVLVGAGLSGVGFLLATSPACGEEPKPNADAAQGEAAEAELSSTQWKARLKAWRKTIPMERMGGRPPRYKALGGAELEAVREQVAAIRDPAAVPALDAMLDAESSHVLQPVWLAPLKDIPGEAAFILLVRMSVEHESEPIRRLAAEAVAQSEDPAKAIDRYVKYLKSPKYCTWAAVSLRQAGLTQRVSSTQPIDPRLVDALIDALILTTTERVPYWYHAWYVSPRPGRTGGFGFSSGSRSGVKDIPVKKPLPNPEVLEALREYTQSDHGYDREAWREETRMFGKESTAD